MKKLFIKDILRKGKRGQKVEILGWVQIARKYKKVIFLGIVDSTGYIQVVISRKRKALRLFTKAKKIKTESSVKIIGTFQSRASNDPEIDVKEIEVIGGVDLVLTPHPRADFDIFNSKFTNLTLKNRHLYFRNQKFMAIMNARCKFFDSVQKWFKRCGFIEIHTPILTQIPLYEHNTAFSLNFFGKKVFLTQCSAFYLESAVHAFEKVYNIGPSFRAEESKSRRHLSEYWHLKAEIAFANLDDIISFAEKTIMNLAKGIDRGCKEELKTLGVELDIKSVDSLPYPRITYKEATQMLERGNGDFKDGHSLGSDEIELISKKFNTPFWITGLPRSIEPFPYVVDPNDPTVTRTADLIAPGATGGELLGVAEKIWDRREFTRRLKEKGKKLKDGYRWYYELRKVGSVPHAGMGMGVERTIRWLFKLEHVRDAIPFPRFFRRTPYP